MVLSSLAVAAMVMAACAFGGVVVIGVANDWNWDYDWSHFWEGNVTDEDTPFDYDYEYNQTCGDNSTANFIPAI